MEKIVIGQMTINLDALPVEDRVRLARVLMEMLPEGDTLEVVREFLGKRNLRLVKHEAE